MTKKNIKIFIILIILLLLACGGYQWLRHHAKPSAFRMPPATVAVARVKQLSYAPQEESTGTIVAKDSVMLSAKMSGLVKVIYFHSGQEVKQGDLLLELDNADLKASLAQAQAKLQLAQKENERYHALSTHGSIARNEAERYASLLAQAIAQVAYQQALLEQTYIRAPFAGKLGLRQVNVGQFIAPGQALVELQSTAPLYVDFKVPFEWMDAVKVGQSVRVHNALLAQPITATIHATAAAIDVASRLLNVRALLPGEQPLLPGMAVQVGFAVSVAKPALFIPQSAIAYSPLGTYVYKLLPDYNVQQVKITVLENQGDDAVIEGNLKTMDQVVVAGQQKLHPGAKVIIAQH